MDVKKAPEGACYDLYLLPIAMALPHWPLVAFICLRPSIESSYYARLVAEVCVCLAVVTIVTDAFKVVVIV